MLDWQYQDRTGDSVAEYRGITIRAVRDESPSNPFEDRDSEPPLAFYSDRSISGDSSIFDPLGDASDAWISRNWRKLAKAIGLDESAHDKEAREGGGNLSDTRRELFNDHLDRGIPNVSDRFEAIANVWTLRGVEALTADSRGYSQGDWATLLIVATPEWAANVGAPRESHAKQLAYAAKLWGYWAWGDVYGYVIDLPDGDSCWGFYGSDFTESGLEEAACNAVDRALANQMRRKVERLKELIRNRVPLDRRGAILATASRMESNYA